MAQRAKAGESAEDRLIARHFRPLAKHAGAAGLSDDAASYTPPKGCDLVVTADALVAGVHFFADDPPDAIAQKALRVNLSDLAAKGARPAGFLLSLAMPTSITDAWLKRFTRGLAADARFYECPLLGGDTVRTPGPLTLSVTAFGTLPEGTIVRRKGASPGDRVFVTGTIGDAALGLLLRTDRGAHRRWRLDPRQEKHLAERYLRAQPRIDLAEAVRRHASAAMDVSDGLAGDLAKLCRVSGVAAVIETARVPLSKAGRGVVAAEPDAIARMLAGGDDYEILCTVPPRKAAAFIRAADRAGVPVAEIGGIAPGRGARFLDDAGHPLRLERWSFSHF